MLDSVKVPFNECIETLCANMRLDPHFLEFYNWAKENNVPIVVLSSGMKPIISALLEKMLGHKPDDNLVIIANDIESRDGQDVNSPGGWKIKYHDDSHFGHDKSLEIKPYQALPDNVRPTLLYAGDGVSDLSAASQTDLLFAKKGNGMYLFICFFSSSLLFFVPPQLIASYSLSADLVNYCDQKGQPYTVFENWDTILATTKDILSGKVSVKKLAEETKTE